MRESWLRRVPETQLSWVLAILSRLCFVLLLSLLAPSLSFAQASTTGQWTALQTWPYRAVHLHLLPDGGVLFWSYYSESQNPQIWDPVSNTVTATATVPYAIFCAGHTTLADGRIFVAGGHIADYVGYQHASIYDPVQNAFLAQPDMNAGRWYPTTTLLPNGDVLVVSGNETSNSTFDTLPQVWQSATGTWRNLTTALYQLPLYPLMFVTPDGRVYDAGPTPNTKFLNPSGTGSWSNGPTHLASIWRSYGPGIMMDGKIMVVGGGQPPIASVEVLNLNSSTPAWSYTGSMHYPRRQHNAVVLPDGKVFVVGGGNNSNFDPSANPIYPTEMWNPATGAWTVMASIAVYRGYHSTAMLLPDGRVLSAGGNVGGPNMQVYSPPYLFTGTSRPTISSAPSSVGYGQQIFIATPDAANISKVSFIRAGSVTHTFDQATRFLTLSFTKTTTGLNVTLPADANHAPPGYYMLFILNNGVPSVASIMRISASGGATGSISGQVTNTSGAGLGGASVTAGNLSATTDGTGHYLITNIPAGTVTVSASLSGYSSASESVSVTAGNTTNAATLQLSPLNSGSVTGLVQNSAGTAIANATVSGAGQTATTDSSGTYTLNNLPAGQVQLTASATGFSPASQTVTITAGTTITAAPFVLTSNTGGVTGVVKSSTTGAAISGATVQYGGGSTTTNTSGAYTLTGVPAGSVNLVASASGFNNQTITVTITGGQTSTANFSLTPVSTSTGTVTGTITNISTGGAISGATVKWSGGSTTSSSTGAYTLTNVTAGTQNITASATGYSARTVAASVTGGTTTTLNIALATGGKIAGTITHNGAALANVTVTMTGGKYSATYTATTSSTGAYNSGWIPIGSYTVTASPGGFTAQSKSATVNTGATTTVSFTF